MKDIKTDCPVCEAEITITGREIKLASQHRKETGGKVLVSCPECCRALALPDPIPEGEADLEAWIHGNSVFNLSKLTAVLVIENALLVKETNDLRKQLGIEPRQSYALTRKCR